MSTTLITAYSGVSLLKALLMMAGNATALVGLGRAWTESMERSVEDTLTALKKQMDKGIASELGRMEGRSEAAWKKLNDALEVFRNELDGRLSRGGTMQNTVADFHALQRRIREEELDTRQCAVRLEEIRGRLHALRAKRSESWERELNRLEAAATSGRLAGLSASERLLRLQGILMELEEMERMAAVAAGANLEGLRETRWVFEDARDEDDSDGPDGRCTRQMLVREIRDLADRVAQMDNMEGAKLRSALSNLSADTPFPDRLHDLRRQMRALWGEVRERVVRTTLFREKLETLYSVVQAAPSPEGDELARRCELLCGGRYIDRAAFMALYEDICRFAFARAEAVADNLFAEKVESALSALGYELMTDAEPEAGVTEALLPEQVRYLESPYEGYRVMAKVGKRGTFTARLVRAVATEEEKNAPSEYQRQKDLETGRKWCRDFDAFLGNLKEQGMPLDVTLRVEPEENDILVVVDRELAEKTARGTRKRRAKKTLAQKMQERNVAGEREF